MNEFRGIRVVATGTKYQTEQGFAAIKNGVKTRDDQAARRRASRSRRGSRRGSRAASVSKACATRCTSHRLATVCEESNLPEHRRVLEQRHCHHHADGRGVHARLPVLLGRHGQSARLARPGGARELGAHRAAHEAEVRRAHVRRSRRPARRRRRALRGLRARDQGGVPRHRGRSADAGLSGNLDDVEIVVDSGSTCSRRTSRP